MAFKQHIPVDRYDTFSACFPLFRPLTCLEKQAIAKGQEFFEQNYGNAQLFPDPFIEIDRVLPTASLHELQIAAPSGSFFSTIAADLASEINSRWGIAITVIGDEHPQELIRSAGPLLLLGGSDVNRGSMEISKKYQIGPFCSKCPGAGGWGVTTHRELEAGMALRYLLACDKTTRDDAIAAYLNEAIDASSSPPRLNWMHRISPGPVLKKALSDFDSWVANYPIPDNRRGNLDRFHTWLESRRNPYRQVFTKLLTKDLVEYYWNHGALPYNADILDIGISALRYYQWTNDEKALDLFRETMWGVWDYLNSGNPQIYISDVDFRTGLLCNEWNWIEHHPKISSEERKAFTLSLLGLTRMVQGYFEKKWKNSPAAFNHRTFKARSLILAWRYFKRWNLPDLPKWKADADEIFTQIPRGAFKFHEEATDYETYVPEHCLVWHESTGQTVPGEMQQALAWFAKRSWAMTDNFFLAVDFGDSDPVLSPRPPH